MFVIRFLKKKDIEEFRDFPCPISYLNIIETNNLKHCSWLVLIEDFKEDIEKFEIERSVFMPGV